MSYIFFGHDRIPDPAWPGAGLGRPICRLWSGDGRPGIGAADCGPGATRRSARAASSDCRLWRQHRRGAFLLGRSHYCFCCLAVMLHFFAVA
jgi:hypothetical protein